MPFNQSKKLALIPFGKRGGNVQRFSSAACQLTARMKLYSSPHAAGRRRARPGSSGTIRSGGGAALEHGLGALVVALKFPTIATPPQ